jgi:hypothetical protein
MPGPGAAAAGERLFDTSVILGSLDPDEAHHAACDRIASAGAHKVYVHALVERFSILAGGRQDRHLSAATATRLIEQSALS